MLENSNISVQEVQNLKTQKFSNWFLQTVSVPIKHELFILFNYIFNINIVILLHSKFRFLTMTKRMTV